MLSAAGNTEYTGHVRIPKTTFKGLAKSRKGSPPISLQTLIDRTKMSAFADELQMSAFGGEKVAAAPPRVTERDVQKAQIVEAKKVLSESPTEQLKGHLAAGVLSGALAPGIQGMRRAIEHGVDAPRGSRAAAALKGWKNTSKGGVAGAAATGMLTAAAISAGRRGLLAQKAKDTVEDLHKKASRRRRAQDALRNAVVGAGIDRARRRKEKN